MFTTWSVRARLTAAAGVAALLLNLLIATLVTPLVYLLLADYVSEQVAATSRRVAFTVERYAADDLLKPVAPVEDIDLIQVLDNKNEVRQASPKLVGKPPLTTVRPTGEDGRVDTTTCVPAMPGCLITVGFRVAVGDEYWMSYAFAPTVPWYIDVKYIAGMVGGALVLAGVTAWISSRGLRRALEPVSAIQNELAEITSTDLGRRVPRASHRDEFDSLAQTINATLDRLEATVEQQRRFASDASHDLRSPITAMRAQVEEAMLHPDDTDWEQTSRALMASIERLQALATDLLALARLESGTPGKQDRLDLGELVATELDRRTPGKTLVRSLEPGVFVVGDRLRLARLLTNLVDNAQRHAVSRIDVSVRTEDGCAVLEVVDDGAGIEAEQREIVFRRFTRLDASRNVDAGGTGLGLPIAREIAKAHGGSLTIEDSARGARFVLRLPMA
ncbi:sensor histidine kinase [Nonomuraea soli]|uniref:histidine kinase n=1 Tax=Nonomuraea soli TaxID=1032476 RepID=A0A7W0HSW4_9ACTN|nr:HAMP domain-containing sensor histidine kinase [Nonomuraea soli]MBA2894352.1 signal transduction histidine kinase [Nonomuraea soli]